MRILSHYFIARFFGLFLIVLVAGLAILATIEFVLNLEELSGSPGIQRGLGPWTTVLQVVEFLWLRVASIYLVDLIAVASFVASFMTFAIAGRRLEGVAIEAGGIRQFRVVLPVLLSACLLSVAAALIHETIVLGAARARLAEAEVDRDEIDLDRRAFWYHRGPIITNIGHADPTTRTLHDVELFERGRGDESGRVLRIVRAQDVQILPNGVWRFEQASVWIFDPADPLAEPRFETATGLELDLASVPSNTLAEADPASLPIRALARYLAREGSEPSPNARRLAEVYHERLSRPWSVLVLCWLALPFGLRIDRRARIAPAAAAALLALTAFFAVSNAGHALTRMAILPVAVAAWTTPLVFIAVATLAIPRRSA